jgi:hypothetical protein
MTVKPRIYVETSVISYLAARPSADVISATRQHFSFQLWQRRTALSLSISEAVRVEAAMGDEDAARTRLAYCDALPVLDVPQSVDDVVAPVALKGGSGKGFYRCDPHRNSGAAWNRVCCELEFPAHCRGGSATQHRKGVDAALREGADDCNPRGNSGELQMKQIDPVMKELWAAKDANTAKFPTVGEYVNYLRLTEARRRKVTRAATVRDGGRSPTRTMTSG